MERVKWSKASASYKAQEGHSRAFGHIHGLATCLLQARHNTASLGLGSKPTAARYHATMLHHPCIDVKKM